MVLFICLENHILVRGKSGNFMPKILNEPCPPVLLQVSALKEQKKAGKKTSQELEKSRKESAERQTRLEQTQEQMEKVCTMCTQSGTFKIKHPFQFL